MKCWTGWSRDRRRVHRELRRRTLAETRQMLARGAGKFCRRKLTGWRCTRQQSLGGFFYRAIRCSQYAEPLLLSVVPEECVSAYPWAPWSVAAFPGASSRCSPPALASWDTGVARTGFSRKSNGRRRAGAAEGEHSEGSSGSAGSGASVCRGLELWRSWCDRPSVASPDDGVLFGRWVEDGRQLWAHWETVGAICANRWASESGSRVDTRRSFGRFRRFPEPLRLPTDSHCCFAFSQLSLLECCSEFCREWLGW